MSGCLVLPLAYIFAATKMKTCNHCIFWSWTFYIGFNGHVPDEYFPDAIKKNWLYLNHTISILWWYAKLRYSPSSIFRVICNKPFHKIRQRTVGDIHAHALTNFHDLRCCTVQELRSSIFCLFTDRQRKAMHVYEPTVRFPKAEKSYSIRAQRAYVCSALTFQK